MIEQLQRLVELAPDVCRQWRTGEHYQIGGYVFNFNPLNELQASYNGTGLQFIPAFDLLQGALQKTIEARGWGWRVDYRENRREFAANIWHGEFTSDLYFADSPAAALLAALIKALEAETE